MAINTSPEPVTNIVASVAEDAAVAAVFWLFIKYMVVAVAVILLTLVASFFFLRFMWRFTRKVFSSEPAKPPPAASPSA